ncbi:hypothetical protein F0P96_16150 [Hymenobacter busanensis]|uniref:Uncharacterized protein n=1 Tax=Hymenobacter busanensis TaxID=2607656 RepID=A0A7L4ZS81_9BACT|nr:hypothetical protein [Hymenobacter busanensis]KAA9327513.1 hypothetical protein F0P96_16150 [Hymenobacter busanensis]QHJ06149.1 hypothetical protein GUY19_02085 [Hymenobacter busanensis]
MNKSLYFLASAALLAAACQRQASEASRPFSSAAARRATAASAPAAEPAAAGRVSASPAPAEAVSAAPSAESKVSENAVRFARQYNLATIWQPGADEHSDVSKNGFFGADYYRIEMALLRVERDPQRPELLRVSGKNRFKQRITPFSGTITVEQVQPLKFKGTFPDSVHNYTLTGRFVFDENPQVAGAGQFSGTVRAEFEVDAHGQATALSYVESDIDARESFGYEFKGQWRGANGRQKPVLWADNFYYLAHEVLSDFDIGEREINISPKYVKRGWDRFWENDEWWAEAPTASL